MGQGRAGCRTRVGAELPALACACRVEGPRRSCAEGEGFLQKNPSKEPHFTDVSWGRSGGWGAWEISRSNEVLWGSDGRLRDSEGEC